MTNLENLGLDPASTSLSTSLSTSASPEAELATRAENLWAEAVVDTVVLSPRRRPRPLADMEVLFVKGQR